MLKLLVACLCLVLSLSAPAQTNFRELSFDQSIEAAKKEGKMVFVDFYTSWCGPCKLMAREVFPLKQVGDYMNSHFVCLKIDAEKGEGIEIAKTYKVRAYPTCLLIDTDKKEVARVVGMKSADAFVGELERLLDPTSTPEKMKDRYEKGERTPKLVKSYAAYLADQALDSRDKYLEKINVVNKMVEDYFSSLSDEGKREEENMFIYRGYITSTEDVPAQYLISNNKMFPAESQEEIKSILKKLFEREEYTLVSGQKIPTAEKIAVFKRQLKQLNLNADGHYNNTLKVMEAYNGSDDAYRTVFKKVFRELNFTQQAALMQSLLTKYGKADEATKKKASRLIRDELSDLDVEMLSKATMYIERLELEGH